MSGIKPGDMGHYYAYMASVMDNRLEALSIGNDKRGLDIPKGVLHGAKHMLEEAATIIKFDRKEMPFPSGANPSRLICLKMLVMDAVSISTGKEWDDNSEEQILNFNRLVRDLPENVRAEREVYEPVGKFFKVLSPNIISFFNFPPFYLFIHLFASKINPI